MLAKVKHATFSAANSEGVVIANLYNYNQKPALHFIVHEWKVHKENTFVYVHYIQTVIFSAPKVSSAGKFKYLEHLNICWAEDLCVHLLSIHQ